MANIFVPMKVFSTIDTRQNIATAAVVLVVLFNLSFPDSLSARIANKRYHFLLRILSGLPATWSLLLGCAQGRKMSEACGHQRGLKHTRACKMAPQCLVFPASMEKNIVEEIEILLRIEKYFCKTIRGCTTFSKIVFKV